jgi:hypothetical protein
MGTAFVHTVLDDHSRVAYAEIHDDETAAIGRGAALGGGLVRRPRGERLAGVIGQRGGLPVAPVARHLHRAGDHAETDLALPAADQRQDRMVPSHDDQRGAFRRLYASEAQRRKALPGWIHEYNHHQPHTAIGGHAPITRSTNLSRHYI